MTAIDYSEATLKANGGNVVVKVNGSEGPATYQAPYVLVTVPLGVLKNNNITFTPPLPADKQVPCIDLCCCDNESERQAWCFVHAVFPQDAIKRVGMGVLDKVFLVFEDPFWDTSSFWLNRIAPAAQVGQWTEFVSPYMYDMIYLLIFDLVLTYTQ